MFLQASDFKDRATPRDQIHWCIRIWDMGVRRPIGRDWSVAGVLIQLGAAEATAPFDDFMQSVHRNAGRYLHIACVAGQGVTADEKGLLDALALAQARRGFESLLRLRALVAGSESALELSELAGRLAASLTRSGLVLDAPDDHAARRFALSGPSENAGQSARWCLDG